MDPSESFFILIELFYQAVIQLSILTGVSNVKLHFKVHRYFKSMNQNSWLNSSFDCHLYKICLFSISSTNMDTKSNRTAKHSFSAWYFSQLIYQSVIEYLILIFNVGNFYPKIKLILLLFYFNNRRQRIHSYLCFLIQLFRHQ